ncbi:MAG: retroviral-like aspartic protease family protein [Chloroflexi bacterium]|nr:retroviral-like aspartic protease family protein [Chloroflexota bacterium]
MDFDFSGISPFVQPLIPKVRLWRPYDDRPPKEVVALVDSGANFVVVSEEITKELGLKDAGWKVSVELAGGGSGDEAPVMLVDIEVEGLPRQCFFAISYGHSNIVLLGMSYLSYFKTQLVDARKFEIAGQRDHFSVF